MSVHRSLPPHVYFVRRTDGEGPVKIGCSQLPLERLACLMVWAPYPLTVVATLPGDETLERRFHAKFVAQHSHREWFRPSVELAAVIDAVAAGTFDVETLPPPRSLAVGRARKPMSPESRRSIGWSHRLSHLRQRDVEVPPEVAKAAFRWGAGPYAKDYDPHNPADAALVEAFLARHPPKRRAA